MSDLIVKANVTPSGNQDWCYYQSKEEAHFIQTTGELSRLGRQNNTFTKCILKHKVEFLHHLRLSCHSNVNFTISTHLPSGTADVSSYTLHKAELRDSHLIFFLEYFKQVTVTNLPIS